MYDYKKATYNSNNLFRRFSHRTRFNLGLKLLSNLNKSKVLDFGCGNGHFLSELKKQYSQNTNTFIGYEIFPEKFMENDFTNEDIKYIFSEDKLAAYIEMNGKFDYITCFEVLEHCSEKIQIHILSKLHDYIKPGGKIIISVPIEIGVSSLLKNIFRFRFSPKKRYSGYTYKNIIKSLLYMPITDYRSSQESLSHMGFDYRDLLGLIRLKFLVEDTIYSPIPKLKHILNSQVFFIISKKGS